VTFPSQNLAGSNRLLDVIEVPTQAEVDPKWTLEQWAEYYHTPIAQRQRILNVISLEVSKTPLNAQIRPPRIVRYVNS
jgi:F-box and leucine-rich repeat protein 10/11